MIQSFKNKHLAEFWNKGSSRKIAADMSRRVRNALDVINRATALPQINMPGLRCHPLVGTKPLRHAVSVSGSWRVTFEWREGHAFLLDFEQYH